MPSNCDHAKIEEWRQGAREQNAMLGIKARREVHYIDKEDLYANIGAAACQERS